jgi:hypothetical protein
MDLGTCPCLYGYYIIGASTYGGQVSAGRFAKGNYWSCIGEILLNKIPTVKRNHEFVNRQ